MNGEQRHWIDLGEGGEASLTIDSPTLKFWKGIDVRYDLSKCKRGYRSLALRSLTEIAKIKLKGRDVIISFKFFEF